jgi:hypothetical protein
MAVIKRSIVLLADGARMDVLSRLISLQKLPNITECLVDGGLCQAAVTSFPSTTGPAYLPFLTGSFPGTCNVPGIRWIDKHKFDENYFSLFRHRSYVGLESFLMGRDLNPGIKTIFELIPKSYSIFNPITRGARGRRNRTRYSRIWYWYYAHMTDRWALADEAALEKTLRVLKKDFRFLFVVFPGIDEYSHLSAPDDAKVIERYLFLDFAVGEISRLLKKRGKWDDTQLWITSDHGLSKTNKHFCVNTFLKERGMAPFFYPLIFDKRGKNVANMVSGNGMTHLYFKRPSGWAGHATFRELESLAPGLISGFLDQDAVDIIAWRDEKGAIGVASRRGKAQIRLEGEKIHYEVRGGDPFGYPVLPVDLNPCMSLEMTMDSDYPDAPCQLARIFTSERAGDVILSAAPGHDLRLKYESPEHKSSHGSLHRDHMLVPMLCSKPFKYRPARTVDVFPTILDFLGIKVPANIDGTAMEPLR